MEGLKAVIPLDSMLETSVGVKLKLSPRGKALPRTPQVFTKPKVAKVQNAAYDDVSTVDREKGKDPRPIRLPKLGDHHPGTRLHLTRPSLGHP